ncbi:hypothetical protein ACHAXA_001020 [Cyclostephanos tholiformis]|uniref:Activator of Hsp90 ATPase AHSA1-like N-terminal domain-containing protein n=1 Tax=Cyclostephanos tholiformis TaxID=382380 RepID=A0ABD3R5N4_9STRA
MSLYSGLGGGVAAGGGPTPLFAHNDLLSASMPDTADSLRAYIDEIKNRGRLCVSSGDLRSADALYGRGIDVLLSSPLPPTPPNDDGGDGASLASMKKKDLAILRSNRSLVRLQMGMAAEALVDATRASEDDPTYVKAHWRMGQAASACGNSNEALASFEKALSLEPNNRALRREVETTRERVTREEEERMKSDAAVSVKNEDAMGSRVITDVTSDGPIGEMTGGTTTSTERGQTHPRQSTTSMSSSTGDVVVVDESEFTKSDHVRGYKIRSDGKKTSFFDREISDDARRLIGDIAPKKLEDNVGGIINGNNNGGGDVGGGIMGGTSAWNKAGTWEERDVTPWAKETLSAALLCASYVLPDGSPSPGSRASIIEVVKLDGNASYAAVRGKKKYIYEFSITVRWELALSSPDGGETTRCRGEMTFPDVDGTVESGEGYDVSNYSVDGTTCSPGIGPLLERFIRDGGLRDSLHGVIDDWVTLFRATY